MWRSGNVISLTLGTALRFTGIFPSPSITTSCTLFSLSHRGAFALDAVRRAMTSDSRTAIACQHLIARLSGSGMPISGYCRIIQSACGCGLVTRVTRSLSARCWSRIRVIPPDAFSPLLHTAPFRLTVQDTIHVRCAAGSFHSPRIHGERNKWRNGFQSKREPCLMLSACFRFSAATLK